MIESEANELMIIEILIVSFAFLTDDANIVAMEMTSPQHHLFHYDKTCSIQIMRLTQKR